jgi:hypothetical protein
LPSPFPHSSAFPTFDQKKRLENEPERKLGTWEKQAKQKGARSLGQAMEQRAKEKEQERRKSQSQGEEELNRGQGRSRGMGAN